MTALSRTGTFVNGEASRLGTDELLRSGDKICIGECVLTFRDAIAPGV